MSQSVAAQLLNGLDHSKVTSIEEEEDVIKNVGAVVILGKSCRIVVRVAAVYGRTLQPAQIQ